MAPVNSIWTVPHLQRYKLPIIALACIAAGATIYYAQTLQSESASSSKKSGNLHRSNASRRRRQRRSAGVPPESEDHEVLEQTSTAGRQTSPQARGAAEAETDAASEYSWEWQDEWKEEDSKDGQGLLLLLYKIAEEQSRRDGYVHRGVACNSCNENPIKGIRYRCANCADYDLCETCESAHTHNREHLFWKIRIPAPHIGTRKERQPVFYPGKPKAIIQDLRRDKVEKFCKDTGYKPEEIEAFWEQFRSMAATEWPNDPDHYGLAIDRSTFNKCFIPSGSRRPAPPNLIFSRIFSYYDTNDDGLIGFDEFIKGLASLKRKNATERLKRVFRGYDVNGDGYVDRRDFLRVFRAYYALTKDLMSDMVAGMQDEDDQDARELVESSQPISSAFNGPGLVQVGDRRQIGAGKVRNNFGDYELVDGMGAVDEHRFDTDLELNSIVSENAEAARWSTGCPSSLSRLNFPRSGNSIHHLVTYAPRQDIQKMLEYYGKFQFPHESDTEETWKSLRRDLHGRIAGELRNHRSNCRDAIIQRARRKSFYQHRDDPSLSLEPPLEVGVMLADPRHHTQMDKDLRDIESSHLDDKFRKELFETIIKYDWPINDVSSFESKLLEMVRKGRTWREISHDLDGYSPDPMIVKDFVHQFVQTLSCLAHEARMQPGHRSDLKKYYKLSRSRSSSNVHFKESQRYAEDGTSESTTASSSPSKPPKEQWDGFEPPEAETDVGQEILFTVIEEALNELLDPVFKLREDLALRAVFEKLPRKRYRANIIAAVSSHENLVKAKQYLEWYSRRWRQKKDQLRSPGLDNEDEAALFAKFVEITPSGSVNHVNGSKCKECLNHDHVSWVRIGEYCSQRQYHSSEPTGQPEGRQLAKEKTFPAERCPMCGQMGEESWISGLYCGRCGQPCSRLITEEEKTRYAIETGGQEMPIDLVGELGTEDGLYERSPSSEQRSTRSDDDEGSPADPAKQEELSGIFDTAPSSSAEQEEPSTQNRHRRSSQLLDDRTTKEILNYTEPLISTTEYTDTTSYPEMAHDLHSSVSAFNDLDSASLEAMITSKPLDELLAESGYASAEPQSSSTESPSPDPTLPQNRPTTVSSLIQPHLPPSASSTATSSSRADGKPIEASPDATPINTSHKKDESCGVPSDARLKFLACLDILESEDKERGGPGRIDFEEFEEIMLGEKGPALGFLASWVEISGF